MCIICAKPSRVDLPSEETISRMFYRNPDGAGIMYTHNGSVKIVKGLMTLNEFFDALDFIKDEIDTNEEAMVLHFRIGTAGGNIPANTHPYPITDSLAQLQALRVVTNIGVAHNGIIHNTPRRKDINDTMEYIMAQLAPLKRAVPKFYQNKHLMAMIKNAITSKMAFLTADKYIYTIGDFIEDNGLLYSNSTYKAYEYRNFHYSYSYPKGSEDTGYWMTGWSDDYYGDDYGNAYLSEGRNIIPLTGTNYKRLMWLDDEDYVITEDGEYLDNNCCILLMDEKDEVYMFDAEEDEAVFIGGAAWNKNGKRLQFDPERATLEWINPRRTYLDDDPRNAVVIEIPAAITEETEEDIEEQSNDKPE